MALLEYEKSLGEGSALGNLPTELHHGIFAYLKPRDVARMRLSCKEMAAVGIQYLVPEVFVVPLSESHKRLQELSEHPVFRQYVTSIFYLGDYLPVYSREQWESQIRGPEKRERLRKMGQFYAAMNGDSDFDESGYELDDDGAMPNHNYTSTQLDEAFARYSEFILDQCQFDVPDHHLEQVGKAMKGLTRVKYLTLSVEGVFDYEHQDLRRKRNKAYAGAFCKPKADYHSQTETGEFQLRSILLGAFRAGIKIEGLKVGNISWHAFEEPSDDFAATVQCLSCLQRLNIQIDGLSVEKGSVNEIRMGSPRRWVEELVASVPLLERLCVAVEPAFVSSACLLNFKILVGDLHWRFLAHVTLGCVSTREDDLVEFFIRHSSTLTGVMLFDVYLTQGSWASTIRKMRQYLTLFKCFFGDLRSVGAETLYDTTAENQEFASRLSTTWFQELLEEYVLRRDEDNSLQEFLSKSMANSHE